MRHEILCQITIIPRIHIFGIKCLPYFKFVARRLAADVVFYVTNPQTLFYI